MSAVILQNSCFSRASVPADLDPLDLDPPSADLDSPIKLSENIILNVLVKMDDTLRSSVYKVRF